MSRHSAHDRAWLRLRAKKLKADPRCEHEGCPERAVTVDHIKPQSTHPELRYEWSNLRSMCGPCHLRIHGKRPRPTIDPATGLPTSGHWWAGR